MRVHCRSYDNQNNQTQHPPDAAVAAVRNTARLLCCALVEAGIKAGDRVLLMPSGKWVHADGALRGGVAELQQLLTEQGAHVSLSSDHLYPSRLDGGYAYTQSLTRDIAHMLGVMGVVWHERAIEAARRWQLTRARLGGKAVMAGPHAHTIHLPNCMHMLFVHVSDVVPSRAS